MRETTLNRLVAGPSNSTIQAALKLHQEQKEKSEAEKVLTIIDRKDQRIMSYVDQIRSLRKREKDLKEMIKKIEEGFDAFVGGDSSKLESLGLI